MKERIHRFRHKFRRNLRDLFMLGVFLAIIFLLYTFVYLKPSNDRNWEEGFDHLPKIELSNNDTFVTITDIKNTVFTDTNEPKTEYLKKTYNINNLERSWFVLEPFTVKPLTNFAGVAHTYFVFDFADSEPIVLSVEARREKEEKYDSWKGMFNQYELIYSWGTEQNQTVRRVIVENNKLFMYPINISKENSQKLFLQLAKSSHELETTPRFYNSFLVNCTNELARNANLVSPNLIPESRAYFFPGYSDEELYKLNLIPTNIPLEELSNRVNITEDVRTLAKDKDFSKKLRENIAKRLSK